MGIQSELGKLIGKPNGINLPFGNESIAPIRNGDLGGWFTHIDRETDWWFPWFYVFSTMAYSGWLVEMGWYHQPVNDALSWIMLEKMKLRNYRVQLGQTSFVGGLNPENYGGYHWYMTIGFETWSRPPVELMGRNIKEA